MRSTRIGRRRQQCGIRFGKRAPWRREMVRLIRILAPETHCPKPAILLSWLAYARARCHAVQDQLEEVNLPRIHARRALSQGLHPAGGGLASTSVPGADSCEGQQKVIVWLPNRQITTTITGLSRSGIDDLPGGRWTLAARGKIRRDARRAAASRRSIIRRGSGTNGGSQ